MVSPPSHTMNEILQLILERNSRETDPFRSIHEAYASLFNLTDALESRCHTAEREVDTLQQQLQDAALETRGNGGKGLNNAALVAALKNETKFRDKLEKLQEEYSAKLKAESQVQAEALKTARRLQDVQDLNTTYEKIMVLMKDEIEKGKLSMKRMEDKVKDSDATTRLAEQQYEGLKASIRALQLENDDLKKENRVLESRLVTEKGKIVDEMNILTQMVDSLKKEVDMLRSLKHQEDNRKTNWFANLKRESNKVATEPAENDGSGDTRKFGTFGVVVPSLPKHTIQAHNMEGTCIRYDDSGSNLIATGSCDGTVKVWDTAQGSVRATLRGSPGHAILACDIAGSLAVGGGTDKTCRVWNLRTERMIHHLVGHQHKITCVRMFGGDKGVITGSADRSLKVWDISRKTYRQTTTLRHSSTSTCVAVASDFTTAVSGHMDGGLRFWDIRSGDRTMDISGSSTLNSTISLINTQSALTNRLRTLSFCEGIQEEGITSVHFNPIDNTQVLVNSLDSSLKIIDVRTGTPVHAFRHAEFTTLHGWSSSCFSPDGRYVAAGSSNNGLLFVWDTSETGDQLKAKLNGGQKSAVIGIDWCRGGSSGQQVASLDRKGVMVLWA